MNSDRSFKIFVDFDGTITQSDVGEEMFLKFGDEKKSYEIVNSWMKDEISSTECWLQLCETVESIDKTEFDRFIDQISLDVGFVDFLNYCNDNSDEIIVVSDGLNYYIDAILKKNKLNNLKVYSNRVEIVDNKLLPSFPYGDEECKDCANCKRNHVINHSGDEEYSIYIGDGYSDKCPAQYCDYIFAKKSLLKYCEKNRVSYFPFTTFYDVIKRIEKIRAKRILKKRHQALLKRRDVYLLG